MFLNEERVPNYKFPSVSDAKKTSTISTFTLAKAIAIWYKRCHILEVLLGEGEAHINPGGVAVASTSGLLCFFTEAKNP